MNTIIAIIIGGGFLSAFCFLFYKIFILAFGKNFIKQHFNRRRWIIFAVVALFGLMLCIYSVSKNSGIYAWDSGGYWHWSYTFTDELYETPLTALTDLYDSIINTDYNLILPTIISLPLRIFGYTFMRYTVINYVLFLVPALFISFCLFLKITTKSKKSSKKLWALGLLMIVCFSVPFDALLKGYIDVAVLIPISLSLALFLKYNPTRSPKAQLPINIAIGVLLAITFLFRRYTAFFVVGFLGALIIYSAYQAFIVKRKRRKLDPIRIKSAALNLLVTGGVSLAILLMFFSALVFRILSEDYSTLYSAYNPELFDKLAAFPTILGFFFIVLALFAIIYSFSKRQYRKVTAFLIISICITIIAFFRVQMMGCHQMYTILIQLLILDSLGLYFVLQLPRGKLSTTLKVTCIVILVLEPLHFFFKPVQNTLAPVNLIFSERFNPIYRSDLSSLQSLRDYLNANSDGNYVYVLASSTTLNSDILKVMDRPHTDNAVAGLVDSHDIDLRDGFPNIFFAAHTIITTTPIQTHLKEGSQEVIRYLAEQIQDPESYIGRHFYKDERTFELEKNVTAYVYHKTSQFTDSDYTQLINYFNSLYPGHENRFGDRIEQFKEEIKNNTTEEKFYSPTTSSTI